MKNFFAHLWNILTGSNYEPVDRRISSSLEAMKEEREKPKAIEIQEGLPAPKVKKPRKPREKSTRTEQKVDRPETRSVQSTTPADDYLTNPLNPLSPLNPIYNSESYGSERHYSQPECDSRHSSSSHDTSSSCHDSSSSYDSGSSSSSDSGSSSSSDSGSCSSGGDF